MIPALGLAAVVLSRDRVSGSVLRMLLSGGEVLLFEAIEKVESSECW